MKRFKTIPGLRFLDGGIILGTWKGTFFSMMIYMTHLWVMGYHNHTLARFSWLQDIPSHKPVGRNISPECTSNMAYWTIFPAWTSSATVDIGWLPEATSNANKQQGKSHEQTNTSRWYPLASLAGDSWRTVPRTAKHQPQHPKIPQISTECRAASRTGPGLATSSLQGVSRSSRSRTTLPCHPATNCPWSHNQWRQRPRFTGALEMLPGLFWYGTPCDLDLVHFFYSLRDGL